MASHKGAFNSATALRRVFMPSNLNASDGLHVTRIFVPALLPYPSQQTRTMKTFWSGASQRKAGNWGNNSNQNTAASDRASTYQQNRNGPPPLSRYNQESQRPRFDSRPRTPPRTKVKLARLPRDDEITSRHVVIEETVDGEVHLSEEKLLSTVLADLDRKTHSLHVIKAPDPDDPEAPPLPICRIINKKEEADRQRQEKELKKKTAGPKEKELEINWAITKHDLDTKLRRLQDFLAKSYRVKLLLAQKSRAKAKATKEEADALVDQVVEAITGVPGAKEWRGREGHVLKTMRLFVEGPSQKTQAAQKMATRPVDKEEAKSSEEKDAETSASS